MKLNRHVVIVTGATDFTDEAKMRQRLLRYPSGTLVIHGMAPGADTMAGRLAREFGFRWLEEPYFFEAGVHGGPKRNQLEVDIGRAYQRAGYNVTVEAFPTPGCTGTWDCVSRADLAGLPIVGVDPSQYK